VTTARDQLELLAPALAFLLAAVPLAHLLGRLGVFDAVARRVAHRVHGTWAWWLLAAVTTIVLNLDTTVVLLTPLYLHVARRRGDDPLVLAAIPFLLANLASSVLPVSNLTNLIAAERYELTTSELVKGLGPASLAMIAVGFLTHRAWAARRPTPAVPPTAQVDLTGSVPADDLAPDLDPLAIAVLDEDTGGDGDPFDEERDDRAALATGAVVVLGLLVSFVVGPPLGIEPWAAVVAADVALALRLRWFPLRAVPFTVAAAVAALAVVVGWAVPGDRLEVAVGHGGAVGVVLGALTAAALSAAVDNLPALLVLLEGVDRSSVLPVLLGVNAGAVLTPIASLANLLWLRTARAHGLAVRGPDALRLGLVVGGPAFLAGVVVLAVQRALGG